MSDDFLMRQLLAIQHPGPRTYSGGPARTSCTSGLQLRPQVQPRDMYACIEREIVGRVLCGEKFGEIAAALNKQGLRGKHGGRWYYASVRASWLATVRRDASVERTAVL